MDVVKKDDQCDRGEILLWQRLKGGAGRSASSLYSNQRYNYYT